AGRQRRRGATDRAELVVADRDGRQRVNGRIGAGVGDQIVPDHRRARENERRRRRVVVGVVGGLDDGQRRRRGQARRLEEHHRILVRVVHVGDRQLEVVGRKRYDGGLADQ